MRPARGTALGAAWKCAVGVLVLCAAVYGAWRGFGAQTMGDFPQHYAPAMNALLAGHVRGFFAHLPLDGASGWLVLSAPAALVGKLLIGGQLAIFRFAALACLLSGAALGLYLAAQMRAQGRAPLARAAVIGLCVLSPTVLDAILYGHPEEGLGATLCIGAVLLAGARRPGLAGVALGLALINKPWALLAIPPVLLAAREGRVQIAVLAGTIAAAWTGAAYLASSANFTRELHAANFPLVAHPPELWWPFAHLRSAAGVTPAYYPPRLINDHARELVLLLAVPLSLPLARQRGRTIEQCLALLALLLLVRCLLDPTNHIYYQVPFVIALTAWEARTRSAPVLALLTTAGVWLSFHTVAGLASLDVQFLAYMAAVLPALVVLARAAFGVVGRPVPVSGRPRLSTA